MKLIDTNASTRRPKGTAQEIDALMILVTAARSVVDAWEAGDLAAAVRELDSALNELPEFKR